VYKQIPIIAEFNFGKTTEKSRDDWEYSFKEARVRIGVQCDLRRRRRRKKVLSLYLTFVLLKFLLMLS
jgi:hypothetical protein